MLPGVTAGVYFSRPMTAARAERLDLPAWWRAWMPRRTISSEALPPAAPPPSPGIWDTLVAQNQFTSVRYCRSAACATAAPLRALLLPAASRCHRRRSLAALLGTRQRSPRAHT